MAEARIHLALLRAAVDRAEQELTRAQRNHREEEAMIMVRHHLSEANRLINAKRHTHSRERSVG